MNSVSEKSFGKALDKIQSLSRTNTELLDALEGLLAHLWDRGQRNVKKDYSLMVAEVTAQNVIRKMRGQD